MKMFHVVCLQYSCAKEIHGKNQDGNYISEQHCKNSSCTATNLPSQNDPCKTVSDGEVRTNS